MSKQDFEIKSLVYIVLIAYIFNQLMGIIGFFCTEGSNLQMVLFQIGNAFAIPASVMAGRYIGTRGEQVAASAFILVGITHGISLGALSRFAINVDRGMTMVMPMIPALTCIFWCSIFPLWLRLSAIVPICLFTLVYINVQIGNSYFAWPMYAGYGTLQFIEVLWGVYLYMDWKQNRPKPATV